MTLGQFGHEAAHPQGQFQTQPEFAGQSEYGPGYAAHQQHLGPYSHMGVAPQSFDYGNGSVAGNMSQYNGSFGYDGLQSPTFETMTNPASPSPSVANHISQAWGSLQTVPPYGNSQQFGGYGGGIGAGITGPKPGGFGQNFHGAIGDGGFKNQQARSQHSGSSRPSSRGSKKSNKGKKKEQQASNLSTAAVVNNSLPSQGVAFQNLQPKIAVVQAIEKAGGQPPRAPSRASHLSQSHSIHSIANKDMGAAGNDNANINRVCILSNSLVISENKKQVANFFDRRRLRSQLELLNSAPSGRTHRLPLPMLLLVDDRTLLPSASP